VDGYQQIYDSPKHGRTLLVRLCLKVLFFMLLVAAIFYSESKTALLVLGILALAVASKAFFGGCACPKCNRKMKIRNGVSTPSGSQQFLVCDHCRIYIDTGSSVGGVS
jgi:hypothetical protein